MTALEVTCNGSKIVLAGSNDLGAGALAAIIEVPNTREDRALLTASGVTQYVEGTPQRALYWKERFPLSFGDEITMRVVQTDSGDLPESEADPLTQE